MPYEWDKTKPTGSQPMSVLDNTCRDIQAGVEDFLDDEHTIDVSNPTAVTCKHAPGSARAGYDTYANRPTSGSGIETGRLFVASDTKGLFVGNGTAVVGLPQCAPVITLLADGKDGLSLPSSADYVILDRSAFIWDERFAAGRSVYFEAVLGYDATSLDTYCNLYDYTNRSYIAGAELHAFGGPRRVRSGALSIPNGHELRVAVKNDSSPIVVYIARLIIL